MLINLDRVEVFFDLRSPYSYLAIGPARALAQRSGVAFDWWPYVTDFQSAYGGEVEQRTSRDVAKLKYLYMDCRRLAKTQGLTVRSTTKLWDPTLASQAVLFAKAGNRLWEFCSPLLAAFWRREFDLESPAQVQALLVNAGLSSAEWNEFLQKDAARALTGALKHAEELGVFGAPTFIYRGEMFWGGDRMNLLEAALLGGTSGE
ncbi:DsbA family protein [Rhodoferax sp. GW822-FHT02A01]|uniref:2-hydroxychromene-2-carboxylate isomerase n=1 Tax=Rhodoferax sp. GW822-FHT02A01 TaxID=3141537 RepID=UPI00315C5606